MAGQQSRVQQGQVSTARYELAGAPLAPQNDETNRALQDRRPREQVRPIPEEVFGLHSITTVAVGDVDVRRLSQKCASWQRSRTWWLFIRDAESVPR